MSEKLRGHKIDASDGLRDRLRRVDEGLTWLRPMPSSVPLGQSPWWPGLDQELVNFHARYERACIED